MKRIPYVSQYDERIALEWRPRACGVAALTSALGRTDVDAVLAAALAAGAYIDGVGWSHQGLVTVAHAYEARAFRHEFRTGFMRSGLYKLIYIVSMLVRGVVPIVSLTQDGKTSTHLVPLVGVSLTGFYYHEPERTTRDDGEMLHMTYATFLRRFRGLAIFVHKV